MTDRCLARTADSAASLMIRSSHRIPRIARGRSGGIALWAVAGRRSRRPKFPSPAPARRKEDLHRQRDHRRLPQDRVRRRISSRRTGRPHPQIPDAGAGVRRRQPFRPQGAALKNRRRHRQTGAASRHRHGRRAATTPSPGQAGARPRPQSHHLTFYGSERARRFAARWIRNACPAFARTRSSKSSIPT